MSVSAASELRSLKDHPFDLLREIERRSKAAIAGAIGDEISVEEWVGIGIRLGEERFIVARDAVREILMVPAQLTRVPGARSWVRGLANVRGHLLPVMDLRAYLGGGMTPRGGSARTLVLTDKEFPIGLMVDEVYGFRRFFEREHSAEVDDTVLRCEKYLAGEYRRGEDVWPVFDLDRLIDSEEFRRAAEE